MGASRRRRQGATTDVYRKILEGQGTRHALSSGFKATATHRETLCRTWARDSHLRIVVAARADRQPTGDPAVRNLDSIFSMLLLVTASAVAQPAWPGVPPAGITLQPVGQNLEVHGSATDARPANADDPTPAARPGSGPDRPLALVFTHVDRWTRCRGATALLEEAEFDVKPFAPRLLDEKAGASLLVFATFCSEAPNYAQLVKRYREPMIAFMKRGGVILQFTQADQTEASPPFLPEGLEAVRCDRDLGSLHVLAPDHPLLENLPLVGAGERGPRCLVLPPLFGRPGSWETFSKQKGFRILVTGDLELRYPVLLEAAVGRGRLLLTSFYFDKVRNDRNEITAPAAIRSTAQHFFANLKRYVERVRTGRAPRVEPTPPYVPPEPLSFVEGSWTLVVLPDTQVYAMKHPEIFEAQTRWIVAHRARRNIAFVLHVGDIVNNNNVPQWKVALECLRRLDGRVNYALAPGNHDFGKGGSTNNRDSLLTRFFPVERMEQAPTFGGLFEKDRLDNSYHLFNAGGLAWIAFALEFGPRHEVVKWVNRVLKKHPRRQALIATHAYLYSDDTRYDHRNRPDQHWNPYAYGVARLPGGVNDGEDLWQRIVMQNEQVAFVVCGHVLNDGVGTLTSRGFRDRVVHQLLANYQMHTRGGEGYLRLMEFLPGNRKVQVKTYSPFLNRYRTDPENQFVLDWKPRPDSPAAPSAPDVPEENGPEPGGL